METDKEKNILSTPMLCHYLTPASIVIERASVSKESIFETLISRLCEVSGIVDRESVQKSVWDREKEGRTVLDNGLAIPHARFGGIQEIKASLALLPMGYEDPQDKIQVHLVFLFLSPQDQFKNHLQMLARISRVFHDKAFIEELLKSQNSEEAFNMLQRKERSS